MAEAIDGVDLPHLNCHFETFPQTRKSWRSRFPGSSWNLLSLESLLPPLSVWDPNIQERHVCLLINSDSGGHPKLLILRLPVVPPHPKANPTCCFLLDLSGIFRYIDREIDRCTLLIPSYLCTVVRFRLVFLFYIPASIDRVHQTSSFLL